MAQMDKVINFILISIIVMTLIGCDQLCSGQKIKKEEQLKIELINLKYASYNLEIDKCLPLGYFNVTLKDEKIIDTLTLNKVFYEVLETNISAKEMQVFNQNKKLLFIQYNYYNPNTKQSKPIRLKPEDL